MGIDFSWCAQLFSKLQQFLPGLGSGIASGVTSGIVVQFLNAIGRKAAKRFQTDAHKKALNLAMAKALDQTAKKVTSDKKIAYILLRYLQPGLNEKMWWMSCRNSLHLTNPVKLI